MAGSSHLREINRRKVVEAMFRLRRATRGEIAHESNLSQPTVGRIADDLLREHFLTEIEPAIPLAAGRPSRLLELDRNQRRFLAIELGVEQTRLAALPVGVADTDVWETQFDTPASAAEWARALTSAARTLRPSTLQTIILSLPGVVDEARSQVVLCPNVRWAEGTDFPHILRKIAPVPVLLIQEIRALALGQLVAEPKLQDFLLVDVGAGVGAAAVVKGQLYHGPLALSGELGHIPVAGNTRLCGCGAKGCVEMLVSRTGLLTSAREQGVARSWPGLVKHVRTHGLEPWLTASLDALAGAIISGINILGMRDVLLSGLLGELSAEAALYVIRAVTHGAMWARFGEVRCRLVPQRRTAGMVLAAIQTTPVTTPSPGSGPKHTL